MNWFYNRIDEWQRDVNIVSSVPIGGGELLTSAGDLTAFADTDTDLLAESASASGAAADAATEGRLTLAGDEWKLADLPTAMPETSHLAFETATAANTLVESMAAWASPASDSGALAGVASRRTLDRWTDLAPASLSS